MIRVLVAEDSVTVRELLVQLLAADPEITVVATAADGVEAVELTKALRPDVVTMDIQMPRMDGLAATKLIMVEAPTPIVIVSSTVTHREVGVTMDALRAGALAARPRPLAPGASGFDAAARAFVNEVKAMSQVKVVRRWPERWANPPAHEASSPLAAPRAGFVQAVAVAASTGGPAALHRIFSALPADFAAPVLVVQHMADGFVTGFADWLGGCTALAVTVARDNDLLAPGTVYVAPDGAHLGLRDAGHIRLADAPPVGGFRPAGTWLFESVARACGVACVGVILTGMGADGCDGLRALKAAGGRVLAQDRASSVVFGMPAAAIEAGLADQILPLGEIADRLVQLVSGGGRA